MGNTKVAFLAIVQVLIIFIILTILNFIVETFVNIFMIKVINWIDNIGVLYKVVVVLIGGGLLISLWFQLCKILCYLLRWPMIKIFPENKIVSVISDWAIIILSIWDFRQFWVLVEHHNVWVICENLILTVLAFLLYSIVTFREKFYISN